MTATIAFLLLTVGQDRPEIAPPDPAAARQHVRDALALYGMGVLRQRQDRLVEAVRCLEEAVRLDPEAAPPRQLLIPLYSAVGRPGDAASAAASVVILDPSQADTWRTLARLLHEMKRTGDAISVLNRCVAAPALADRPADRILAYRDLARLHSALGTNPQAADACRKALGLLAEQRTTLLKNAEPADLDRDRAEILDSLAAANLAAGKFAEARDAALEARDGFFKLKDSARIDDVGLRLAAAYAGLRDTEKAHALLDNYLAIRLRDVAAFALKARLLREAGDGHAALVLLTRATQAAPDSIPLCVLLGDECRQLGEIRQAEQAYRVALARNADVRAYRGLFAVLAGPGGNPTALLDVIDAKVRERTPDQINAVDPQATLRQFLAAGEHTRAIAAALRQEPAAAGLALTTAVNEIGRSPDRSYDTWGLLASVAERTGQIATAEKLFRTARAAAARASDQKYQYQFTNGLLQILWAQRKGEETVDLCEAAIKAESMESFRPYFRGRMAWFLMKLDRVEEALKTSAETIKEAHGPQILGERIRRLDILAHAERFDVAEAEGLALLNEVKLPIDIQQVRHALAIVFSTARQFDKAEEQLRLILELDPADAEAHNSLGYELADRGRDLDEAERLIRRALELDRTRKSDSLDDEGENGNYLDSLGWLLFRRGRFAEAKELVERATTTPATAAVPEVWDHLGDICARMNKPAEAAAAWEKARELARTEKRTINDQRGAEIERKLKRLRRD